MDPLEAGPSLVDDYLNNRISGVNLVSPNSYLDAAEPGDFENGVVAPVMEAGVNSSGDPERQAEAIRRALGDNPEIVRMGAHVDEDLARQVWGDSAVDAALSNDRAPSD